MIQARLHRRIANDDVSADDVSLNCRGQKQAVCVPNHRVVLDEVVIGASALYTNSKVVILGRVPISTCPVRTEPAAADAAEHSYAPAGIGTISIAYGSVPADFVAGATAH